MTVKEKSKVGEAMTWWDGMGAGALNWWQLIKRCRPCGVE